MVTISERGKVICVLAAEKSELFRQASVLTGQMYLESAKHITTMTSLSRQHELLLNKIAALELTENKL